MGKEIVRFRECDFCQSQEGIVTNKVNINGHKYEIDLCPQHMSDMDDDFFTWTSCGTKVGEPTVFDQPREAVRLVLSDQPKFGPSPALVTDQSVLDRVTELPLTAQRWTITHHARERMDERGFTMQQVLWTAEQPTLVTPNPDHPGTVEHSRGDCLVVVDPETLSVLTVKYSSKHPLSPHYKKASAH